MECVEVRRCPRGGTSAASSFNTNDAKAASALSCAFVQMSLTFLLSPAVFVSHLTQVISCYIWDFISQLWDGEASFGLNISVHQEFPLQATRSDILLDVVGGASPTHYIFWQLS